MGWIQLCADLSSQYSDTTEYRPWLYQSHELRHGPSNSLGPDITMVMGGNQAYSSLLWLLGKFLCPQNMNHCICLSLSTTSQPSFAHYSAFLLGTARRQDGLCFLLGAQGISSYVCICLSFFCSDHYGIEQNQASNINILITILTVILLCGCHNYEKLCNMCFKGH